MLIRFRANTYIRRSPFEIGDKHLGHVNEGSVIEVEDEVIEGLLHEGVNTWYKDLRGWYYWGGEIEEISAEEEVQIQEDMVLLEENVSNSASDSGGESTAPEIPTEFDEQEESVAEGETEDNSRASTMANPEPQKEVAEEQMVDHPKIPDYMLKDNWADEIVDTKDTEDSEEHPSSDVSTNPLNTETNEEEIKQQEENDSVEEDLNWSIKQLQIKKLFWDQQIKGKGVKVAMLDTGIKADHPLFSHLSLDEVDDEGYLVKLRNFTRESETGETNENDDPSKIKDIFDIEDESGQGTCNAGIIAALGAEDHEKIGLASEIELYVGKIQASKADEVAFDTLQTAVEWTMEVGVNILFIGTTFKKSAFEKEVQEDLIDLGEEIQKNGIILIAPVGDTARPVPIGHYPAALPTALSVGAFDKNGDRYSNTAHSFSLDVLAPGVALRTTNLRDGIEENYTGTTAAAAYTTGLMALLLRYLREHCIPCCNPGKMIGLLQESAKGPDESKSKIRSHINGFGKVDPTRFIELSKEKTKAPACA